MTDPWDKLAAHRATTQDRSIIALFEAEPDRARDCALSAEGLWFDWSKTAIDGTARDLLLALAADVPARREAMAARKPLSSMGVRAVPMMRAPSGKWPAEWRRNRAGKILRRARSPVAPKMTRSKSSTTVRRDAIAFTVPFRLRPWW